MPVEKNRRGKRTKDAVCSKLTAHERMRYSRNMLIGEWNGKTGQLKLKDSTVLVVGAGGSGSSLLYYLAAGGVGTIKVCDGDKVNLDNLNRQIIHDENRIGINKARSAKTTLTRFNSDIKIIAYPNYLNADNVKELAADCNIICCAADERKDRLAMKLVNRFSFENRIPVAWAGGVYMGGFVTFMEPPATPCMECFIAHSDAAIKAMQEGLIPATEDSVLPSQGPNPIVGAAAGVAGALQAMETIKYLVGIGTNLRNKLLLFQMKSAVVFNQYEMTKIRRPDCPYCGID